MFSIVTLVMGTSALTLDAKSSCVQSDCMPGSICIGSECVHIRCVQDFQCPRGQQCRPLSYGLATGTEKFCQLPETTEQEALMMLEMNPASHCCHDFDCESDQECVFYNTKLSDMRDRCDMSKFMQHGYCRTKYGSCSSSCDCGIGSLCIKSGSREGFCACNQADESLCGRHCSDNEECLSKCEVCKFGHCKRTPGINGCAEEKQSCRKSDSSVCKLGGTKQCCSDCDCTSSCLGSECSCSGQCTGPVPWFCPSKKRTDRNYCSRTFLNDHCEYESCCVQSHCTPFYLCPSNETLSKGRRPDQRIEERDPFEHEYCFHKHFSFEGQPIPNCAADDVQSVHDCRSRCIRTKSCKYFTWHQRAKTCTLYSSASNLFLSNDALVRRNAISGYLYCPKDWNRLEESSCHHQSTGCYEVKPIPDDVSCLESELGPPALVPNPIPDSWKKNVDNMLQKHTDEIEDLKRGQGTNEERMQDLNNKVRRLEDKMTESGNMKSHLDDLQRRVGAVEREIISLKRWPVPLTRAQIEDFINNLLRPITNSLDDKVNELEDKIEDNVDDIDKVADRLRDFLGQMGDLGGVRGLENNLQDLENQLRRLRDQLNNDRQQSRPQTRPPLSRPQTRPPPSRLQTRPPPSRPSSGPVYVDVLTTNKVNYCRGPFIYKGKFYRTCSIVDGNQKPPLGWCALDLNADRTFNVWENCLKMIGCNLPTRSGRKCVAFTFQGNRFDAGECTYGKVGAGDPWCAISPGVSDAVLLATRQSGVVWDYCNPRCVMKG